MTDYLFGAMVQPNTPISISGAIIADNVSVTGSSLPTNGLYLSAANTLSMATASTQRMVVDPNGNFLLGTTTNTGWRLRDIGSVRSFQLGSTDTNNNDKYSLISSNHYNNTTYTDGFALIGGQSWSSLENNVKIGGWFGEALAATGIQFYTAANYTTTSGTERMRITSTGNVGIGTSTTSVFTQLMLNRWSTVDAPIMLFDNRGTNAGDNVNTYTIGGMVGSAYRDISNPSYVASVTFERQPFSGGASSSGAIVFGTMGNGTTALPTERMRINASGYVTMANQPCFHAYSASSIAAGAIWTGWTAAVNITSSFNTTTGVFTAPVAGTYMFSFGALANATSSLEVFARKNNVDINGGTAIRVANGGASGGDSCTFYITLALNDTISLYINQGPTNTNQNFNFFNGRLIQ